MDETRVLIGDDVLLDIGVNSEWYICSISYDRLNQNRPTIIVELHRKDESTDCPWR